VARAAIERDLENLRIGLKAEIDRVVIRLGSLIAVVAGLLFAALHHWPPQR
jgi:hypothetical protein